jgi:hypothetical protein
LEELDDLAGWIIEQDLLAAGRLGAPPVALGDS